MNAVFEPLIVPVGVSDTSWLGVMQFPAVLVAKQGAMMPLANVEVAFRPI